MPRPYAYITLIFVPFVLLWTQGSGLWQGTVSPKTLRQEPLTVGTNIWPGYEPLYLARDLELYQNEEIRLVEYSSATQVLRALRNQLIDIGALTLDEALLLRQSQLPVQIILVTDVSEGGDVIMAKPEIDQLEDLRGKRVGVEDTALGAYFLTRALQSVELQVAEVTIVPVQVNRHLEAYQEDRVDAVVTFEPVRSQLLKEGAHSLFDSSQIPGEVVDVLVARESALKEKPQLIQKLVDGWFQALAHLDKTPQDAVNRMSKRLDLSPDEIMASYEGLHLPGREENKTLFGDATSSPLTKTIARLSQVMVAENLLNPGVQLDDLLAPQLGSAAQK